MTNPLIRFHEILNYVNDQLTHDNRNMLCFLMDADIPRALADEITAPASRVPMHNIFRALMERGKISPTDLNYLVERLKIIQRIDLVQYIRQRVPTEAPAAAAAAAPPSNSTASSSNLFRKHNAQPTEQ